MKRKDQMNKNVRRRQAAARVSMKKLTDKWRRGKTPVLPVRAPSLTPGSPIVLRLEALGVQCGTMNPLETDPDFFRVVLTRNGIKLGRVRANGAYVIVDIKDSTSTIATVGCLQEIGGTTITWSVIKP